MSDPVVGAVGGSLSALLSPPLIALFSGACDYRRAVTARVVVVVFPFAER